VSPSNSRHNECTKEHDGHNDGIASHADLKEQLIDIGIPKKMVKEVAIEDYYSCHYNPKAIADVHQDLICQLLSLLIVRSTSSIVLLQKLYLLLLAYS
jgi:hypothetical protein